MIRLRPHHLLCTQSYAGMGYSAEFVRNMDEIVHRLRTIPETKIRLTFSADSLCACCPHRNSENRCDAQEKVAVFDRRTVEAFDLQEGEYVYRDLIAAIYAKMTPTLLSHICAGCSWYPVSACERKICGK